MQTHVPPTHWISVEYWLEFGDFWLNCNQHTCFLVGSFHFQKSFIFNLLAKKSVAKGTTCRAKRSSKSSQRWAPFSSISIKKKNNNKTTKCSFELNRFNSSGKPTENIRWIFIDNQISNRNEKLIRVNSAIYQRKINGLRFHFWINCVVLTKVSQLLFIKLNPIKTILPSILLDWQCHQRDHW